ncbi:MAG: hypothetical protein ABS58_09265 [Mesorhizobium sp. SCN 65-20]|nr:MAG: hypothetical protein ABS58_09265 [Mesorhizobium sp. SCN 65-20]
MKKIIIAASALAMMSGAALASTDGVIAKYNADVRVITLENGKSFTVPRDVALPQLQVGEKVSIQLNDERDKVTGVLKSL